MITEVLQFYCKVRIWGEQQLWSCSMEGSGVFLKACKVQVTLRVTAVLELQE